MSAGSHESREQGGIGDHHHISQDGTIPQHRDTPTEEPSDLPLVNDGQDPTTPTEAPVAAMQYPETTTTRPSLSDVYELPQFLNELTASLGTNREVRYNPSLTELSPHYYEQKPTVDGTKYAEEAFGGFGPSSPEYDSEHRLTIVVPNPKDAVRWFFETETKPPSSESMYGFGLFDTELGTESKSFAVKFSTAQHPGVKTAEVRFVTSDETSLVTGRVEAHHGALQPADVPETDENGAIIDTSKPAKRMLKQHLTERLIASYGEQLAASAHGDELVIALDSQLSIHVSLTRLPRLDVGVNGLASGGTPVRFGSNEHTAKSLAAELVALQEHFPNIAEAYADFFRKQLPKATIKVSYAASSDEQAHDPVNPQRMASLRQELVTEPREDDFRYIGGLSDEVAKLQKAALGFAHPEAFREFGVKPPRGILLKGAPGVGKTSLVNAFAREAGAVVLSVKASTIKSAFHGETERNIRGAFALADELIAEGERVVMFFDEIEALAPARGMAGSTHIDNNVTTELLQGMNVDRTNCVIIAATNIPGMIDPALTGNASRFSQQIEVSMPDKDARLDIATKLMQKFADRSASGEFNRLFSPDIDISMLASAAEGLSGADIESAIQAVLLDMATALATTGEAPSPATHSQLHRAIMSAVMARETKKQNYL